MSFDEWIFEDPYESMGRDCDDEIPYAPEFYKGMPYADYQESTYVWKKYQHIQAETPKAFLFIIKGEEHWIAKSQIQKHKKKKQKILIPDWIGGL